ncbi:hypothetical protein SDC9_120104 [bioreactor metagenome]|uniref:Uncharacterized protein n=1 Tax=bioreactor metagenome TaxID=1076179 RepID=A0A645C6Y2_9ZZZZ
MIKLIDFGIKKMIGCHFLLAQRQIGVFMIVHIVPGNVQIQPFALNANGVPHMIAGFPGICVHRGSRHQPVPDTRLPQHAVCEHRIALTDPRFVFIHAIGGEIFGTSGDAIVCICLDKIVNGFHPIQIAFIHDIEGGHRLCHKFGKLLFLLLCLAVGKGYGRNILARPGADVFR